MWSRFRASTSAIALASVVAFSGWSLGAPAEGKVEGKKEGRPSLSLKGTPSISFAPTTITLVGTVKGGPDDAEEFYCPAIEWDWDDGTVSERSTDCPPYAPGTSEIERRYTIRHVYTAPGEYVVRLALKRNDNVVAAAITTVTVHPGLGGR
ncbi:MAG: PKD domain-containing protein [Vicinamibacterales bacterium]